MQRSPGVKLKGHMNYQEEAITIQQVSQRLNVPKPTLRFWEREFVGILAPLRTNGGQRRYAPEHVSIIEEIIMLKKAGLSLVEIKRKLGKGIGDLLIGRFDDWEKGRDGGQMSDAGLRPIGAYAPVGSQTCPQRSRHPGTCPPMPGVGRRVAKLSRGWTNGRD